MSTVDSLRAATSTAGAVLGRPRTGVVAMGAPADLVIVADDPFDDLRNLRQVWGVIRGGRQVSPGASRRGTRSAPPNG
jgi:imidazolonepropionase-like amidohydrolase